MSSPVVTCGRVRRLLWPDSGPRAASAELIDAQQHLARCAGCQAFVHEMRIQGELLRDSAPRQLAPAEVRRRLFTGVARARAGGGGGVQPTPHRLVPVAWLVAGVTVLVVLGGTLAVDHVVRHGTVDPMSALADDHARALGAAQIASADPAVVSRWLAGQVHFAMFVPSLPNARLLGARLRVADGRRGAALQYELNGVAVTYFVIPNDDDGYQPPIAGQSVFKYLTRAGYHVVAWREPGLLHAMVGSVSESQLAALADACIKQARRTVASVSGGKAFQIQRRPNDAITDL